MSQYTQPAPRPERPPKESRKRTRRTQGLSYKRKAPEPSKWAGFAVAPAEQTPESEVRQKALREAQDAARERWRWQCIVEGCPRNGMHLHHAYARGPNPELEMWAEPKNLWPICSLHHREAQKPGPLQAALQDATDELLSTRRKDEPDRAEVHRIIRRHREQAEKPHPSPMGRSD